MLHKMELLLTNMLFIIRKTHNSTSYKFFKCYT
mgnify:CR=1 FL=1